MRFRSLIEIFGKESINRFPVFFRKPKAGNGVFCTLENVLFLRRGAGLINQRKVFDENKIVLVAVNEKGRRFLLFELHNGGALAEEEAVHQLVDEACGRDNDFRRKVIFSYALVNENLLDTAKAAVLNGKNNVCRELFAGRHHRCCATH